MNTNVIFRYIKCKQKQKKKYFNLSGLKNCHKIIYRKRFLNDNRNIVLTRNITKGRFWNMSENNNYKNIFLCLLLLPNSSERRSRFQTMLHFCQNQVHDMSPVLLLALSQKSHGGVVELMKKQKNTIRNLIGISFSPCPLNLASITIYHPLYIWFLIRLIL